MKVRCSLRGHLPVARGVTHRGRAVREGESATFDDHLVLTLTKALGPEAGD